MISLQAPGVSAVVHVASPILFSPNPENVIPSSIAVALNALKAANKSPSVKRFVFTSSSVAAALPKPNKRGIEVTADSWNTHSVEIAWREAPYHPQRAWHVYAASKVEAETAVWRFHYENIRRRYDLVVNTGQPVRSRYLVIRPVTNYSAVLPGTNFGKPLDVVNQGHPSTSSFVESLWNGTHFDRLASIPPRMLSVLPTFPFGLADTNLRVLCGCPGYCQTPRGSGRAPQRPE